MVLLVLKKWKEKKKDASGELARISNVANFMLFGRRHLGCSLEMSKYNKLDTGLNMWRSVKRCDP